MTEEERKTRAQHIKEMAYSIGGRILIQHIKEDSDHGWNEFIDLPVEKKTSKTSYDYQAKYKVSKELIDWIEREIKLAE